MKSFPKMGSISAPPLFIEEVDAKRTEEFVAVGTFIYKNSLPPSGCSLYKQRES